MHPYNFLIYVEDECKLSDTYKQIKIEKLPYLQRVEVVPYSYNAFNQPGLGVPAPIVQIEDIPPECLDIYNNFVGVIIPPEYSDKGLLGLHQSLILLHNKVDSVYNDAIKAIDPISTITYNDLYKFCDNSEIKREDYPLTDEGEQQYIEAVQQYFYQLLIDSKYGYLVQDIDLESSSDLISAPNNWITEILTDFSLIQSRINNTAICNIEIQEQADVVSLVAQENVIAKATGKYLVLHFVTLDNYPKRGANSPYWQIQIPAAKESYEWEQDFELLRWERGNQYAQLRFNEFKNPVAGFFKNQDSANAYFDAVLSLTTATQKNRVMSVHSNPKTSVAERLTRPYRAFIQSVNDQGQAVCHVKYVPLEEANNG